ncbi:MAG TPA: SRPBCC family protein [Nocardioidaceae bacterium]|nr:SRPBCC family protein [Nocardioidaceae bacterium]
MATNAREIKTVPEKVWAVLADGWLYPLWVVGATRMRDVDAAWPQQGSKIHHSAGVWPAVLDDNTEVLDSDPGRMLRLRARGWPIGEAEVTITLTPSGANTLVEIAEKAVSGPGALIPPPIEAVLMKWRNSETLRRLAYVAENRQIST